MLLAPGEIGRGPNATGGHEDLVAQLEDAASVTVYWGLEHNVLGFEARLVTGSSPVEVENEFGVPFPNHGKRPLLWTAGLLVFPLSALREKSIARVLQPVATLGIGGALVSMDLDNIDDQSLHHPFQWSIGAGLRILVVDDDPDALDGFDFLLDDTETFVELRVTRYRTWRNEPLYSFDLVAATVGLGVRF